MSKRSTLLLIVVLAVALIASPVSMISAARPADFSAACGNYSYTYVERDRIGGYWTFTGTIILSDTSGGNTVFTYSEINTPGDYNYPIYRYYTCVGPITPRQVG